MGREKRLGHCDSSVSLIWSSRTFSGEMRNLVSFEITLLPSYYRPNLSFLYQCVMEIP